MEARTKTILKSGNRLFARPCVEQKYSTTPATAAEKETQTWFYDSNTYQVKSLANPTLCWEGRSTNKGQLTLQTCNDGKLTQKFMYNFVNTLDENGTINYAIEHGQLTFMHHVNSTVQIFQNKLILQPRLHNWIGTLKISSDNLY